MFKKLTLLLAAVAVVAFAVPSLASASSITSSAGKLTPVGTKITATGTNITQTTSTLGAITCKKLTFNFTVVKNASSTFEGEGTNSNPATESCMNGMRTLVFTSFDVSKLLSTTSGSGTVNIKAIEDLAGITCTLIGTSVPFTYTPGSNTIVFSSATGITSSPAACGTEKLDGSFALEIGGTPVILD
jgi:hypothetical protein